MILLYKVCSVALRSFLDSRYPAKKLLRITFYRLSDTMCWVINSALPILPIDLKGLSAAGLFCLVVVEDWDSYTSLTSVI